ncbi:unnamed protein product [Prorocentrum cordatum]|uniref:Pentatricopeptide repeat-containing protein, chloroplastic n=1 Tax=Prorocentrum cordatum TaxID=2364126 RepID=A0ABN9WQ32_9DINO|nr:unnamed protein product [Polarella glacialis]
MARGSASGNQAVSGEASCFAYTPVSYNAVTSACEKGDQWHWALALLSEMWEANLEPDDISYSAGISACEKGGQWQRALSLLSEMWEAKLVPNAMSCSAGILACDRSGQGQRAIWLLKDLQAQFQSWGQRVRGR